MPQQCPATAGPTGTGQSTCGGLGARSPRSPACVSKRGFQVAKTQTGVSHMGLMPAQFALEQSEEEQKSDAVFFCSFLFDSSDFWSFPCFPSC